MIAKLTGIVDFVGQDQVIIDVGGVGYRVYAPTKTLSRLPDIGQKATLLIEHIIRQDHQQLCGFYDESERACFKGLTNVQGVGVKVALAILSAFTPSELTDAILTQNKALLSRADGVGPKLAGRLVLELKDKALGFASSTTFMPHTSDMAVQATSTQDAIEGLVSLGYTRAEASNALSSVVAQNGVKEPVQNLIRLSLQKLARV